MYGEISSKQSRRQTSVQLGERPSPNIWSTQGETWVDRQYYYPMSKKVKESQRSVSTATQQKIAKATNRMTFVLDSRTGFVTRKEI